MLTVYSVAGSRAYFTYTDASLYNTPEQAKAAVASLSALDKEDLQKATDALLRGLDFPPLDVNVLAIGDVSPVDLGDVARSRDYTLSVTAIIVDVHELQFSRGRVAARVLLGGVHKQTTPESVQSIARIIAERIEPFMLAQ